MGALLLRLRTWWETADRTQRAVTLFGGAFLVLLLGSTFYFASRPRFEMAFGGLTPADQGSVVAEIQKLGIPVEFDVRGNVLVPSKDLAQVKAQLAMAGKLPDSGHIGNEQLATLGMMITPSVERERLKSILEGELARSIEFIDGVDRARVHISLGDQSAFASESRPATASVTIDEKGAGSIGPEQARAIARLVSNAVTSLEPRNVSIMGSDGRSLFDGTDSEGSGGIIDRKLAAEDKESRRRERLLQAKLDQFFGRSNTSVTFDVVLGFDHGTERKTSLRTPEDAVPLSEQTSKESMTSATGSAAIGEAFSANTGLAPAAPASSSGGGNYENSQKVAQYPYDQTETNIQKAAGDIKKMTVSVMVDESAIRAQAAQAQELAKAEGRTLSTLSEQEPVRKVEEFVRGYLGLEDGESGDEVVSFKVVPVAKAPLVENPSAAGANEQLQQLVSFLPIAALLLVGSMVVRAIGKSANQRNVLVAALPDGTVLPVQGGLGASNGATWATPPADEARADVRHPGTIHANEMAKALEARQEDVEIGEIQSRLNVPLEQIKKMSGDRPEVVAMLIKGWLLEDRR